MLTIAGSTLVLHYPSRSYLPSLWRILDYKCDLWSQNQANITRYSEIVCNATVTASVQRSVFSDLLWAAVAVQFLTGTVKALLT